MRAWVQRATARRSAGSRASTVSDHGFTVGDGVFEAVKVVDGRPFALTRHLARLARSAAGLGLPALDDDDGTRGGGGVLEAEHLPLGRLRITYTGGVAPLGSGRGRQPADAGRGRRRHEPAAPTTAVVTVPWPRNERGALAGLKTTSYAENVVALAYAAGARRDRGGLRQPGRAPVRGHRLERLLRRRRRAAHPDPRGRLPGRDHAAPCSSSGTAAARSTSRSRCSPRPTRSSWSPRPATCRP